MALTTLSLKWPRGQLQVACEDLEVPGGADGHSGRASTRARLTQRGREEPCPAPFLNNRTGHPARVGQPHSLCNSLLKQRRAQCGFPPRFPFLGLSMNLLLSQSNSQFQFILTWRRGGDGGLVPCCAVCPNKDSRK